MRRAGAIYQQTILGLATLMAERTRLKARLPARSHHASRRPTTTRSNGRRRAGSRRSLLGTGKAGFLSDAEAVRASFADLGCHLAAVGAGARASLDLALETLSPEAIDAEARAQGLSLRGRAATCRDIHERRHAALVASGEGGEDALTRAFGDAYEALLPGRARMNEPARAAARAPEWRFASVALSHAGAGRKLNEDRLLDRAAAGLWAVADGMGGHRAGDVAAARVIGRAGGGRARRHRATPFSSDVLGAIERVNAALYARQLAGGEASGSTLVALLVHEGHYACLWAGDSRAYLYRDGRLDRDHARPQHRPAPRRRWRRWRRANGAATPSAHVITRAIGADPAGRDRAAVRRRSRDGDIFLLCSDGLTACLDDREIAATCWPDATGARRRTRSSRRRWRGSRRTMSA